MSQTLSLEHENQSAVDTSSTAVSRSNGTFLPNCGVALILAACAFCAFGKSLGAYFLANDEAWHLPLLHKAFSGDWSLIYGQFAAPYMFNKSLLLMYRPLTEVSLAVDFAIWGTNPFGYYLTNIILHIANSFLIFIGNRQLMDFLLVRKTSSYDISKGALYLVALSAAILFAAFPAHAEVVCWISDRNDSLGALFFLSSIVSYMHYLRCDRWHWRYLSLALCGLGLFTKESCATIPLVILTFDYAFAGREGQDKTSKVERIKRSFSRTWTFFALFSVYFVCRWLALGEPYGGYIGSIGHQIRKSIVTRITSPDHIWRLLHPLNVHIFGTNHALDVTLRATYSTCAALLALGGFFLPCARDRVRAALFLFFIAFLIFAPALNTWYLNDGLFGARHAYLALFPAILGFVLFVLPISKIGHFMNAPQIFRALGASAFACTAIAYLFIAAGNSTAWWNAGENARLVKQGIENQVATLAPGMRLVVFNLPITTAGLNTFFSTEFLPGLLKPPLTPENISDKVICIDGAPVNRGFINFSMLEKLVEQPQTYRVVAWNRKTRTFTPVDRSLLGLTSSATCDDLPVLALGTFKQLDENQLKKTSVFSNRTKGGDLESFLIPTGRIKPLDARVVEIKLSCKRTRNSLPIDGAIDRAFELRNIQIDAEDKIKNASIGLLSWSGQAPSDLDTMQIVKFPVTDDGAARTYTIELSHFKEWLVNGGIEAFRLDLPRRDVRFPKSGEADFSYQVISAKVKNYAELVPQLRLTGDAELTSIGLLSPRSSILSFNYDARSISNAAGIVVEISKPYCEFDLYSHHYRDKKLCRYAMKRMSIPSTHGTFNLERALLNNQAYYQVRIAAVDINGNVVGYTSDPVSLTTRDNTGLR